MDVSNLCAGQKIFDSFEKKNVLNFRQLQQFDITHRDYKTAKQYGIPYGIYPFSDKVKKKQLINSFILQIINK